MHKIKCFEVFKNAFRRMADILFRPFDISTWFVLGLSAWLATLFNGFSFNPGKFDYSRGDEAMINIFSGDSSIITGICNYLHIEKYIFWLIIFGTAALVLFIIVAVNLVILWLSSRFKFIYIDNLASQKVEITTNWSRFKKIGNSAFLWFLCWGIVCIAFGVLSFTIIVLTCYPVVIDLLKKETLDISNIRLFILSLTFLCYVAGGLILLFALYFFNEFVLLVMYKKDLPAQAAYREFLKLLTAAPLTFAKFLILQILASIACLIAVALFVLATLGITLIPLFIPYISTVILLPVLVFQRLQAMELLAAFGPEYSPYASAAEETAVPQG